MKDYDGVGNKQFLIHMSLDLIQLNLTTFPLLNSSLSLWSCLSNQQPEQQNPLESSQQHRNWIRDFLIVFHIKAKNKLLLTDTIMVSEVQSDVLCH